MEIADVQGIGAAHAKGLVAAGVRTDRDLLAAGATRAGRFWLASQARVPEPQLKSWVNHCDLSLLDGVGPRFATLLEAAGVDCCAELARRDPHHLAETLADLVATRGTVRGAPTTGEVGTWIQQAQAAANAVEQ